MRNNPRGVAAVAVLLSAGLAAGAAFALVEADDEGTTAATRPDVSVTPSPTPSETATPEPTGSPTATSSAAPTPTASVSASTSSTSTASARPQATSSTFAYPKPTRTYAGLTLTVTTNPGGGNTGTTFELTAKGEDGDGEVYFDGLSWGDGAAVPPPGSPQQCKSYPPLTSAPGPYEPAPDKATYRYTHRYTTPGTYTVQVQVSSVNKDCKPNGPAKETRNVTLTVRVVSATATPTPTPS